MKKKIILGMLILIMLFILVGCGEIKADKGNTTKFEGYTVLDRMGTSFCLDEYLVYDNDTHIMYTFCRTYNGWFVKCPYYVMNGDNEPVIGVYNGDEEWSE